MSDNTTSHEMISRICKSLYGEVPALSRLASNNNEVYLLEFLSPRGERVIKLASPSRAPQVLKEQRILRALGQTGLEVPEVEHTQDDFAGCPRAFTLMPRLPGVSLEEFDASCGHASESAWRKAGQFVSRLAGLDPAGLPPEATHSPWEIGISDIRGALVKHGLSSSQLSGVLDELEGLFTGQVGFIHGDYGQGQVVTDGSSFAVVDWESCGAWYPLAMLGRFIAMVREYTKKEPELRIAWTIEGYEEAGRLDGGSLRSLQLFELFSHLSDASWKLGWGEHGLSLVRKVERLSREWSLG